MIETAESKHDDGEDDAEGGGKSLFGSVFHRPDGQGDKRAAKDRGTKGGQPPILRRRFRRNDELCLLDDGVCDRQSVYEQSNEGYAEYVAEEAHGQLPEVFEAHFGNSRDHARKQTHFVGDDRVNSEGEQDGTDDFSPRAVEGASPKGGGPAKTDHESRRQCHKDK